MCPRSSPSTDTVTPDFVSPAISRSSFASLFVSILALLKRQTTTFEARKVSWYSVPCSTACVWFGVEPGRERKSQTADDRVARMNETHVGRLRTRVRDEVAWRGADFFLRVNHQDARDPHKN